MKAKLLLILMIFLLIGPVISTFAKSTSQGMPWESPLEKIRDALAGPTTMIIGTILIVAGGILVAVTEGQAVKRVFWTVIGLGISLNAASLIANLFGNASGMLI